tara:strand:- start:121 stop:390 length:270 start_codon:yes stop_codon:yes gene_type:complete
LIAILCVEQALGLAGMLWSGRWTSALAAAAASASLAVPSAEGGVLVPGPQRDGLSCGARAGCSGWLDGSSAEAQCWRQSLWEQRLLEAA